MTLSPLPIDSLIPRIAETLAHAQTLILKAAPGAGKTTRVPPALQRVVEGEILVLEPRRLAARLSAERIAEELGEPCGQTVGFHIRFEQNLSAATRVRFITEGLFLRYLHSDPRLSHVGCVVLDEFHERHIHSDVAFALTRRLQGTVRPDLKLVIMSATLNTDTLQNALPDARVLESEGRVFPVEVEYAPPPPRWSLADAVADGASRLFRDPRCAGHILAFLPGVADIRRAAEQLAPFAAKAGADLVELRAEIPFAEQRRAFVDSGRRKIILSTNVAETSLTINGVTGVVDCGLAKIPGHAAWSGLPTLDVKPVSRSSCIQRSGRAGRTAAGVALRLFEPHDFERRPATEKPEILRSDLAQFLLDLIVSLENLGIRGIGEIGTLPWLDAPPEKMTAAALQLLELLGATDGEGRLTGLGRKMARYPLHPRLSRVLEAAASQGQGAQGALAAALLSEGMLFPKGSEARAIHHSDVEYQMEIFLRGNKAGRGSDPVRQKRVEALFRALCSAAGVSARIEKIDSALVTRALLAGFPDRVAQVRKKPANQRTSNRIDLTLCQGGGAFLSPGSVVQADEFLIALDADESPSSGNAAFSTQVHVAAGVEPSLLLDDTAGFLCEKETHEWDSQSERVRSSSKVLYGQLVLDDTPLRSPGPAGERCLLQALKQRWPKPFEDAAALESLEPRCRVLREAGFSVAVPALEGESFEEFLAFICEGKKSFQEIAERSLADYLGEYLPSDALRVLDELAPRQIVIGLGRKTTVHYEEGKPPWVASRLQDFFGSTATPTIGRGRIPLVVHLLAPNGQALQVTHDLSGFWERAYPVLRKEYSRRYPRHFWPEDPKNAEPPPPHRNRPRPS